MRWILGVLAALLLAGCSASPPASPTAPRQDINLGTPDLVKQKARAGIPDCPAPTGHNELPAVTLPCLGGGRPVAMNQLAGPVLVNFWQSTCEPCRKEMPLLAEFARTHPEVTVIGVDFQDQQPAAALKLAGDSKVDYPVVGDPLGDLDATGTVPRVAMLPFTMLVDADGKVVAKQFVEFKSAEQLQQFVATYVPGLA